MWNSWSLVCFYTSPESIPQPLPVPDVCLWFQTASAQPTRIPTENPLLVSKWATHSRGLRMQQIETRPRWFRSHLLKTHTCNGPKNKYCIPGPPLPHSSYSRNKFYSIQNYIKGIVIWAWYYFEYQHYIFSVLCICLFSDLIFILLFYYPPLHMKMWVQNRKYILTYIFKMM